MEFGSPTCFVLLQLSDTEKRGICLVGAHDLRTVSTDAFDSGDDEVVMTLQVSLEMQTGKEVRKQTFATRKRFLWRRSRIPNEAEMRMSSAAIERSQLSQLSLYYEEAELMNTKVIADFEAMRRSSPDPSGTLASAKQLLPSH